MLVICVLIAQMTACYLCFNSTDDCLLSMFEVAGYALHILHFACLCIYVGGLCAVFRNGSIHVGGLCVLGINVYVGGLCALWRNVYVGGLCALWKNVYVGGLCAT